jgi:hypothetical protein
MDETRRKEMRRAHAKHPHTCKCGRTVHGNGGWASHKWACRVYQTAGHDRLDRYEHNPARCDTCPK